MQNISAKYMTLSQVRNWRRPQATPIFYLAAVEKMWEWPGDEASA